MGRVTAGFGVQQLGLALGDLGVLGIQHGEGQGLGAAHHAILAIFDTAEDRLGEDLLAGPVEGPLREGV